LGSSWARGRGGSDRAIVELTLGLATADGARRAGRGIRARIRRVSPVSEPSKRDERDEPPNPFGLFSLLVVVALIVGGWLLIDTLSRAAKTQDCIQSGRRNCAPIEAPER
jgi:hypothetical protein